MPVRIIRAVATIRIPGPVRVVDDVGRVWIAVAPIGIGDRIRIVGIAAQLAAVVAVAVVQPGRIGGVGVGGAVVGILRAITPIRVVDAVGRIFRTMPAIRIADGIGIVGVLA